MFNQDYYPTPPNLIEKMLSYVDIRKVKTILEPSAGKGNLIEALIEEGKKNNTRYSNCHLDIDCIEIDQNLQHILKGKGFRLVNNDFLKHDTYKAYNLLFCNFPFSEGDRHLKKALDMLEFNGGQLVCLVNAETIKNPYSNLRKEIINILNMHEANIEFLENQFQDAERKTGVEVALINVNIIRKEVGSIIIENLKRAKEEEEKKEEFKQIVDNDFVKAIITQYNFELNAGMNLITEYKKLESFLGRSFQEDRYSPILTLRLSGDKNCLEPGEINLRNEYLRKVRYKYWEALFNNKEFTKLLTTNLRTDFQNKLSELSDYDFNEFNIKEIKNQMNNQVVKGVEETILNLFDEFSHKHYYGEGSKNIHMFNGWKTNSCYKINKKVITRINAFDDWNNKFYCTKWAAIEKLSDIEKVFNYLDTGRSENIDLQEVLKAAEKEGQTKGIITKYFKIDFYIKGTAHLTFLDEELLKKFNVFGSQKRGWLPPSYSKKKYKDMTKEEQDVIDSFEGEKEYNEVCKNTDYYIYNPTQILMLGS